MGEGKDEADKCKCQLQMDLDLDLDSLLLLARQLHPRTDGQSPPVSPAARTVFFPVAAFLFSFSVPFFFFSSSPKTTYSNHRRGLSFPLPWRFRRVCRE